MKIISLDQNSPEWLAWRMSGFGSSDAAAILGMSKFMTAYQLYLQKKGLAPGFSGNAYTQAGHDVEDKARAVYEIAHGDFETFTPICLEHSKYDFMLASLDGYSSDLKRILEIKYPSEESHNLALSGSIPEHYMVQVQYQLTVCDEAKHAHYWSFRESNGAMVNIERDEKFINEILLPGVIAFKDLIDSNTPPPLTDKDAKWVDDKETMSYFNEIKAEKDKEKKSAIAKKILEIAGHCKVRSSIGLVTDVKKNGIHSYYKFTASASI